MREGRAVVHVNLNCPASAYTFNKNTGVHFCDHILALGGFTVEGIGGIFKSPASAMILFYYFPEDKPAGNGHHGTQTVVYYLP